MTGRFTEQPTAAGELWRYIATCMCDRDAS